MKFSILFHIFLFISLSSSNENENIDNDPSVVLPNQTTNTENASNSDNPIQPIASRQPRQQQFVRYPQQQIRIQQQQQQQQQQIKRPIANQQLQQDQSPINSAIEMLNMVTKFTTQTNQMYKAAQKLARDNGLLNSKDGMIDPITFIPSIIIYGSIKLLSYMVSTLIYTTSLIAPWQIDSNAKLSFIDLESLHSIDYDTISNSLRSVPERSFKLLDIREEECKSRAMCEIGQKLHTYWPEIAKYIRLAVEQLNIASDDNNTMAMLRGLGWADCEETFRQSQCQRSPFKKFYEILIALQKLLKQNYYQF